MKTHQPNPKPTSFMVSVLHKLTGEKLNGKTLDVLAVGRTFRFVRSKTAYTVLSSGAVVRADPKPWRNKAERKRFIKARRAEREALA